MPSSPWLIRGIDTVDPTYYTPGMAMGRRKNRARTPGLWSATNELPRTGVRVQAGRQVSLAHQDNT